MIGLAQAFCKDVTCFVYMVCVAEYHPPGVANLHFQAVKLNTDAQMPTAQFQTLTLGALSTHPSALNPKQ